MAQRGRSRGRGGSKPIYKWTGIQFPLANVVVAGLYHEITLASDLENAGNVTLERIRGFIMISNSGSDAATAGVECGLKIMETRLDDALNVSDDTQGIDVHIEDIATRQLWTYYTRLHAMGAAADASDIDLRQIEIDVRVKVKILGGGKSSVGLFSDAGSVNRVQIAGYLRGLLRVS